MCPFTVQHLCYKDKLADLLLAIYDGFSANPGDLSVYNATDYKRKKISAEIEMLWKMVTEVGVQLAIKATRCTLPFCYIKARKINSKSRRSVSLTETTFVIEQLSWYSVTEVAHRRHLIELAAPERREV